MVKLNGTNRKSLLIKIARVKNKLYYKLSLTLFLKIHGVHGITSQLFFKLKQIIM